MSEITNTPTPFAADRGSHLHRLALVKGHERWSFSWERGSEAAVREVVAELARDPRVNFDRFDAAVVCHHLDGAPGSSSGSPK